MAPCIFEGFVCFVCSEVRATCLGIVCGEAAAGCRYMPWRVLESLITASHCLPRNEGLAAVCAAALLRCSVWAGGAAGDGRAGRGRPDLAACEPATHGLARRPRRDRECREHRAAPGRALAACHRLPLPVAAPEPGEPSRSERSRVVVCRAGPGRVGSSAACRRCVSCALGSNKPRQVGPNLTSRGSD